MSIILDGYPKYWSKKGKEINLSFKKAKKFIRYLRKKHKGYVSFDTETETLGKKYNRLISIQFSIDDKDGYVICLDAPYTDYTTEQSSIIKKELKKLFESKHTDIIWIAQNAQFDISQVISQLGVLYIQAPVYDTQMFVHILDENRINVGNYSPLKTNAARTRIGMCEEFFKYTAYEKEAMEARVGNHLSVLDKKQFVTYAGMDGYVTMRVFLYLKEYAKKIGYWEKAQKLLKYVISDSLKMLAWISISGFYVNRNHLLYLLSEQSPIVSRLRYISNEYKNNPTIRAVNKWLYKSSSHNLSSTFGMNDPWIFDINIQEHKKALFFTSPVGFKYKSSTYSTDSYFQKEHKDNPIVALYSEEQGLKKLLTAYLNPVYSILTSSPDCIDSRVRASFRMNGTVTGRLSSFSPNLQQVPRSDTWEKKQIKCMYAAPASKDKNNPRVLLQADFCANEIRFWGAISGDPNLCAAFNTSYKKGVEFRNNPLDKNLEEEAHLLGDIHKQTASQMYEVPINKVTPALRQDSKSLSLGIMYQRGTKSVAKQLNITEEEAKEKFDKFFSKYGVGVQWSERMKKEIVANGYVESPLGRRRHLQDTVSKGKMLIKKANSMPRGKVSKELWREGNGLIASAERQAVNSPIQGLASDVALISCFLLFKYIIKHNKDWKIVNSVHDSVVLELSASDVLEASRVIRKKLTVDNRKYVKKYFNWEMPCHVDIDFELSQGKMWKCPKCNSIIPYWKKECTSSKDGVVCGTKKKKLVEVKFNNAYGALVSWNETEQELKKISKGF